MPCCAARRDLGDTFKWAFLGTSNTDTAIFVDAAHNVVKGLDADMPYFLTGKPMGLLSLSLKDSSEPSEALVLAAYGCLQVLHAKAGK